MFWIIVPLFLIYLNKKFLLPVFYFGYLKYLSILFFFIDISIFLYCNRLFFKFGGGTFMPIEPTKKFVEKGLYRYIRNPIYVGHFLGFLGIFLLFGNLLLLLYAFAMLTCIHLMVVLLEEPDLKKKFKKSYMDYTKRVKRWGFF
jgi:protein-S-isoprenylcysteine O-methyltransferase Ste14